MSYPAHDGSDASAETLAMPIAESAPWSHLRFRRRRFLVHRRYQLRVTAVTVGTLFVVLLALNFTLFASNHKSTQAAVQVAPELKSYFAAQDRFQIGLTILGSLAFLAGVFLLGILETHRTAGASFNLCRCLDQLRDGRYSVRVRLRRGDNLKEIEMAFNEMADALQERSHRDAAVLDEMAGRTERITAADAAALAYEMRKLAEEKRLLAG
jgi:methyl-accepting chemotaxis protein